MGRLELDDIQGIVLSGFPALAKARYLLLELGNATSSRAWLTDALDGIRSGAGGPPDSGSCAQVAFTFAGLARLGLCHQALGGFSREFQEGMWDNERRRRVLGDVGESDPASWSWGGPRSPELHGMLLLYADSEPALEERTTRERERLESHGGRVLDALDTSELPARKEHFGFRDGISQPKLEGLGRTHDALHRVAPGEFVLGYPNGREQYTSRPMVDPIQDPAALLPGDAVGSDQRDFGRNGSYLVFRQLAQDVAGFWRWFDRRTAGPDGAPDAEARVRLAAKAVGRWPGGAPLVRSPDRDDSGLAEENAFRYHDEDPDGLHCPVGAHVRRTNPRDSLPPEPGSEKSLAINRRHRLLRRGRPYGPPLAASMAPEDLLAAGDDGAERGLHFLCFNASIGRQFEFVQHTWANNPNFAGLVGETDPVIGVRGGGRDAFTVPECPVRTHHDALPRFVAVRGGAYLFVPGMRALRYLAAGARELGSERGAPRLPASYEPPTTSLRILRAVNDGLERAVGWSRRLTRTRALFDRTLQRPLAAAVQVWMQRRRRDEGLAIAEERLIPGEEEIALRIARQMNRFLFAHYRHGVAERAGNTKTYGLVRGVFEVSPDLAPDLRVGLFAEPRAYRAWVRFGGPGPLVTPDIRNNGVLSLGVKLMGVPGAKLIDDEQHTLDWTGISAPTFTTPNVVENLKLQRHIFQGTSVFYFLDPFDSHYLDAIMQGLYARAHGNPLEARYWSCVPYLFGEGRAFKYSFVPRVADATSVPRRPGPDYLREAMVRTLSAGEVVFDFCVQLQTDAHRMPIEDAGVEWPERLSPFVPLATLRLPRQRFDSPVQLAFARNLSFNPWHGLPAHRPLGNQNRARRDIYLETSRMRRDINGEEHVEPTGDEFGGG